MSTLQVANVVFVTSGSTRIDTDAAGANLTITVDSANVIYANPIRTVFPTGYVNVANSLQVSGIANVSGDMTVDGALRGAGVANVAGDMTIVGTVRQGPGNVSGDMAVTGNVFTGAVLNQSVSMGYVPWAYFTGNTTLTWTGLTPAKQIKLKIGGVLPGATGSLLRMYLSSDGGTNYGPAIQLGYASPNGNLTSHEIVVSNTAISGASKRIMSHGGGTTTATPIGYAQINTESTITGVINAVKMNSTGVIAFTTAGAGIGGVIVFGEV